MEFEYYIHLGYIKIILKEIECKFHKQSTCVKRGILSNISLHIWCDVIMRKGYIFYGFIGLIKIFKFRFVQKKTY